MTYKKKFETDITETSNKRKNIKNLRRNIK